MVLPGSFLVEVGDTAAVDAEAPEPSTWMLLGTGLAMIPLRKTFHFVSKPSAKPVLDPLSLCFYNYLMVSAVSLSHAHNNARDDGMGLHDGPRHLSHVEGHRPDRLALARVG